MEDSVEVSISAINRTLKNFHYSLKNVTTVPEKKNCTTTLEKRHQYAQDFRLLEASVEEKNIVFLDEVEFSVVSRPKKGRSPKGTSAFSNVPAARSRNISVIAAMNKYNLNDYIQIIF